MALVVVGIWMIALVAFAGLGVDVGHIALQKNWLQATADAVALAGVHELPDGNPNPICQKIADANYDDTGTVVATSDIVPGRWNREQGIFSPGAEPPNALRVIARRASVNGNPVETIVMGALGFPIADISAVAIAARAGDGPRERFLIDDEMIDSDIPVIEELAASLGKTPDAVISDGNADGFIDLPPGTELELPTGQVGDEALFEILPPDFPFSPTSSPYTLADFLRHQEGQGPIPDSMLDPLNGVDAVSEAIRYPSFVNPDELLVSPVYKSDISSLGDTQVNAKGERRGLLAFRIIGIGADPDGEGSKLPNIIIRVGNPGDVNLSDVSVVPGGGGVSLVR